MIVCRTPLSIPRIGMCIGLLTKVEVVAGEDIGDGVEEYFEDVPDDEEDSLRG
jgi:hypothetical protein